MLKGRRVVGIKTNVCCDKDGQTSKKIYFDIQANNECVCCVSVKWSHVNVVSNPNPGTEYFRTSKE